MAFQDYYRTTLLAEETDPDKLHDLKAALDAAQVYSPEQVQQVVELFLGGSDRDKLDPILDTCVAVYVERLDEDEQVDFKGKAAWQGDATPLEGRHAGLQTVRRES